MSKFDLCPMQEVQPGIFRVCHCPRLDSIEEHLAQLAARFGHRYHGEIGNIADDPTTIPIPSPDAVSPDAPAA